MGAAPMAYTLWTRFLRHAPTHPDWPDRDRFVLSRRPRLDAPLLAAPPDRLRRLARRPEVVPPVGLEDAGPPGVRPDAGRRGDDRAARPGLRERRRDGDRRAPPRRRVQPRRPRHRRPLDVHALLRRRPPGGHRVRGRVASPATSGCASSSPSTTTTTSSSTARPSMAWSEDVVARFEAYGWHATRVEDGNDIEAIAAAIEEARADDRPSLIAVRTHIGYGSPNQQDTQKAHGQPLGRGRGPPRQGGLRLGSRQDVLRAARGARALPAGDPGRRRPRRGLGARVRGATPTTTPTWRRRSGGGSSSGRLPDGWDAGLKTYAGRRGGRHPQREPGRDPGPGRSRSRELFGGAADLSESNLTDVKGEGDFEADDARSQPPVRRPRARDGRRSPTGSPTTAGSSRTSATFLTFSDYMRGSVRLAALSGLHVIYVWTHDSVGLGEDGPTHQPVEHYAALRAIPNLWFVRPGDANEAAAAWALAIERGADDPSGPVALSLTRQKLPTLAGTAEKAREGVRRGGYVLREASGGGDAADHPDRDRLGAPARVRRRRGARGATASPARVVSLPCWERFELQDAAYRESVLPRGRPRPGRRRGRRLARLGALGRRRGRDRRARPLRRVGARPGRSSRSSASRSIASPPSPATCSRGKVRGPHPDARARATCPAPRRRPPDARPTGDAGVDRTPSSDPGHS